jgi:hypothetical protein
LIWMMIKRPEGLLPATITKRELHVRDEELDVAAGAAAAGD